MPTIDTLNLALSCGALLSFAALGIVALPWTREELLASERAWRALFALPRQLLAAYSAPVRTSRAGTSRAGTPHAGTSRAGTPHAVTASVARPVRRRRATAGVALAAR